MAKVLDLVSGAGGCQIPELPFQQFGPGVIQCMDQFSLRLAEVDEGDVDAVQLVPDMSPI